MKSLLQILEARHSPQYDYKDVVARIRNASSRLMNLNTWFTVVVGIWESYGTFRRVILLEKIHHKDFCLFCFIISLCFLLYIFLCVSVSLPVSVSLCRSVSASVSISHCFLNASVSLSCLPRHDGLSLWNHVLKWPLLFLNGFWLCCSITATEAYWSQASVEQATVQSSFTEETTLEGTGSKLGRPKLCRIRHQLLYCSSWQEHLTDWKRRRILSHLSLSSWGGAEGWDGSVCGGQGCHSAWSHLSKQGAETQAEV